MPLSNYRELLPRMIDHLRGCNQDRIPINALKDAGREFCRRTEAWRIELDPIDIVADQAEYDFDTEIPWDATILRMIWVKTGGTTSDPIPDSYYVMVDDTTMEFQDSVIPSAALTDGLVVKMALMPRLSSVELSEWFLEHWAEAIVGGALSRLLQQEKKPWYNPELAKQFFLDWRRGLCHAKAEVTRGNKPGPDYVYG